MDELKPLEPTPVEQQQIDELLRVNPRLDYLMALVLVKSSPSDLEELAKQSKRPYEPMSSTIIKDAFYLDNDQI